MSSSVLVVDDSNGVLRIAETVLSEAGYQVTCLQEGKRAVEVANEVAPKLILLDYEMPDVAGYQICRELGDHDHLAEIPIVIMSGRNEPIKDLFIRELGIVDHINKPFAAEALLAVVEHTAGRPNERRRPFFAAGLPRKRTAAQRLANELSDALGSEDPELAASLSKTLVAEDTGPAIRDLFFERQDRPGLSGDLTVIGIAEVVQLLSLQKQSGELRVVRDDMAISIAFKDGEVRLVTGEGVDDEFLLGNILLRENLVDADELDTLLSNRRGTRRRLGNQLLKLGYLSREQLHAALRHQSTELVYELLRWTRGRFAFLQRDELSDAVLEFEFGLSTDQLMMEGFRRVDEWGLIEDALPDFEAVLEPVPGGAGKVGPDGLTEEEQRILNRVDGKLTAKQIVTKWPGGTFAGSKLLYRLISAHVVKAI